MRRRTNVRPLLRVARRPEDVGERRRGRRALDPALKKRPTPRRDRPPLIPCVGAPSPPALPHLRVRGFTARTSSALVCCIFAALRFPGPRVRLVFSGAGHVGPRTLYPICSSLRRAVQAPQTFFHTSPIAPTSRSSPTLCTSASSRRSASTSPSDSPPPPPWRSATPVAKPVAERPPTVSSCPRPPSETPSFTAFRDSSRLAPSSSIPLCFRRASRGVTLSPSRASP